LKESATFPTLRSLKEEKQFGAYFAVHSAALEFNLLMKAGEEGSKYHGKSIEFHTGISDPSALTTACLIEGYGQFAQKLEGVKGVTREEFVTAFEEALGFVHRDTHLFRNVRDWYTEEEGFSKEFLDFVHTAEPS
ncbi:MAG: hypothetical protein U1C56_01890, partial [Candidatus Curtissbacteria bacterium]|nr:hypothetical protein [Candidatus Curtissbacteria bacterium]